MNSCPWVVSSDGSRTCGPWAPRRDELGFGAGGVLPAAGSGVAKKKNGDHPSDSGCVELLASGVGPTTRDG